MQRIDLRRAVPEHGALVDRALVGDLALVDRGGSASSTARAMRLALPVPAAASVSTNCCSQARTGGLAITSLMAAPAGRPARPRNACVGNSIAPISFRLRPVITASCT